MQHPNLSAQAYLNQVLTAREIVDATLQKGIVHCSDGGVLQYFGANGPTDERFVKQALERIFDEDSNARVVLVTGSHGSRQGLNASDMHGEDRRDYQDKEFTEEDLNSIRTSSRIPKRGQIFIIQAGNTLQLSTVPLNTTHIVNASCYGRIVDETSSMNAILTFLKENRSFEAVTGYNLRAR